MILHLKKKYNRIDAMEKEKDPIIGFVNTAVGTECLGKSNYKTLNGMLKEKDDEFLYSVIAHCKREKKPDSTEGQLINHVEAEIRRREALYHKKHSSWIKWATVVIAFATVLPLAMKFCSCLIT